MKKLLVAALLASAIAIPASAAELVTNGGFEDAAGLESGWSHTLNPTLDVLSSSAAHGGTSWARFIADNEDSSDELFQYLDTVVGQTYAYSFWIGGSTTAANALSAFHATLGSYAILDLAGSGTFEYYNVTGTYVASAAITLLHFTAFNSLGLYLLDDVSVTSVNAATCEKRLGCTGGGPGGEGEGGGVPEPESWALMVLGFAGLGAAVRRRPRAQTA